jgi:hypothetical protein
MTKDLVTRTPVNNKQRSTKHTHKTKDRVTRTPVKNKQRSTKHSLVLCVCFVERCLLFTGVRVTRSLVLCVCFVERCLLFNTNPSK